MWLKHERYDQVVDNGWQPGGLDLADLSAELKRMQYKLTAWSSMEFGSVNKQLKILRRRLEIIRGTSLCSGPSREECVLMNKNCRSPGERGNNDETTLTRSVAC